LGTENKFDVDGNLNPEFERKRKEVLRKDEDLLAKVTQEEVVKEEQRKAEENKSLIEKGIGEEVDKKTKPLKDELEKLKTELAQTTDDDARSTKEQEIKRQEDKITTKTEEVNQRSYGNLEAASKIVDDVKIKVATTEKELDEAMKTAEKRAVSSATYARQISYMRKLKGAERNWSKVSKAAGVGTAGAAGTALLATSATAGLAGAGLVAGGVVTHNISSRKKAYYDHLERIYGADGSTKSKNTQREKSILSLAEEIKKTNPKETITPDTKTNDSAA
jgi:hypothetical protein